MTAVDLHHLPDAEPLPRPELPSFRIKADWHDSYPVGETPHFDMRPPKSSSEEEEGDACAT